MVSEVLAATPPMGWNSWNLFGERVDERAVGEMAAAIAGSDLKACGYQYVVIDDCWAVKDGRDGNGDLIADPAKFPNGIKALADYVHSLGLKIGIYSDAAAMTCARYPGSYGFEEQDAALWASWGIDFLKYDYCHAPSDQESAIDRYGRMGAALNKSGREILYSLCEWGGRAPYLWGRKVGGQMWRVTGDVFDSWVNAWAEGDPGFYGNGISSASDIAADVAEYGGPGGWNDLDMLVVGLKGSGHIAGGGMSFDEYQTHMSIWCIACSPLMMTCDVRSLDGNTAALLLNREVLAVNQDSLGAPGRLVKRVNGCDIWRKPLADGSTAVAVCNRAATQAEISMRAAWIGLLDTPKLVRNLWRQQDVADFRAELPVHVRPHQTVLLKISS